MTVADRRGSMGKDTGDCFPIGMRILAVDDDLICLKVLESLLIHCKYHVTTTTRATEALRMLRENRDQFDLIISDVHMPDMDGFKLLELVGLEMDLPVIMLSSDGHTEAVMKGIDHGACDYLVKPVRLQELKNIWQHVVRRKISDTQDDTNSDSEEDCANSQIVNLEGGQQCPLTTSAADRNERLNRKRKEHNEEDEDDSEGNGNQKKQRVVWTVELHRKFVDAVNRLGVDRAVPKKILDAMNVENLTRENVASHLQKFRLYLRRITSMANHQVNMYAALRSRQASYVPEGQFEKFRRVHTLGGSRQLVPAALFQPNGSLGRMDTSTGSTGFRQQGITPSGIFQHAHVNKSTSNCINIGQPSSVGDNFLQGMPMSLDLDRLQRCNPAKGENNLFAGTYYGNELAIGSSSKSAPNATSNHRVLPTNQQLTQSGTLGCQSSIRVPSLSSDPYQIGGHNNNWRDAVQSDYYPANFSTVAVSTNNNTIPPLNSLGNATPGMSPIIPMNSQHHKVSSVSVAATPLCDSGINSYVSSFLSNPTSNWEELNHNVTHNTNPILSSTSSLAGLRITDTIAENARVNNAPPNTNMEMGHILGQGYRTTNQQNYMEEHPADSVRLHDSLGPIDSNFYNLENDLSFLGAEMIGDYYSGGTHI